MNNFRIINYQPQYRQHFIDLNTEWLTKYFVVEPHDYQTFNNIEKDIIEKEGEIFFCVYENKIVGTVAMILIEVGIFELAKMAVTANYQGKGISNLLMDACIQFAKRKNAVKIMLVSNRKLVSALSLYKKYGFAEVPMAATDYSRADIQMELML